MVNKVMVSFPEEFLEEVDRIADEEHRSRSELIREALRVYISSRQGRMRPGDDPRVQWAVQIQNKLSAVSPGSGEDSSLDVRRWREEHSRFQ
jgi:metal-responsive CopG/Arc/MetJ family transcriptional regulator